ncbi:hypothetical protein FB45DRAFT_862213 [Roridomyces roridus]|uniref:Uncharacterized protein n=1 Tax=Roridomyces roridus TaxID=1738132 RepID=A0AAD7CCH9_9AGAR|nr:hypothetical protein FB45DRAFT_862213 [Roridomyces roridus]
MGSVFLSRRIKSTTGVYPERFCIRRRIMMTPDSACSSPGQDDRFVRSPEEATHRPGPRDHPLAARSALMVTATALLSYKTTSLFFKEAIPFLDGALSVDMYVPVVTTSSRLYLRHGGATPPADDLGCIAIAAFIAASIAQNIVGSTQPGFINLLERRSSVRRIGASRTKKDCVFEHLIPGTNEQMGAEGLLEFFSRMVEPMRLGVESECKPGNLQYVETGSNGPLLGTHGSRRRKKDAQKRTHHRIPNRTDNFNAGSCIRRTEATRRAALKILFPDRRADESPLWDSTPPRKPKPTVPPRGSNEASPYCHGVGSLLGPTG